MIHPNPYFMVIHDAILFQIWMVVMTCSNLDWDEFQIGMTIPIQIGMHSKLDVTYIMYYHHSMAEPKSPQAASPSATTGTAQTEYVMANC
jgi:hypothetical protein